MLQTVCYNGPFCSLSAMGGYLGLLQSFQISSTPLDLMNYNAVVFAGGAYISESSSISVVNVF